MRSLTLPAAAVAVLLAGCDAPPPAAAPPAAARAELAPGAAAQATGEARFLVRPVDAAGDAVTAQCAAAGSGFEAAFAAPAELAVPTFGPASGPVRVDCAAGSLRGARLVEPAARRANGIAGWPAVGIGVSSGGGSYVSVGGFWNGGWGSGPGTWAVRYPDVEIPLQ